jgi:hypothetical protein
MGMLNCVLSEAQVVAVFGLLDDERDNEIKVDPFVRRLCARADESFEPPRCQTKEVPNFVPRLDPGQQKGSLVPAERLRERAPGRHGERRLRLASGEVLQSVMNDPHGPAWRLPGGAQASAETHLPRFSVTAVELAHGELLASVALVSKALAEVRGGSGVGPGVGPGVGLGVGPGVRGIPEIGGHKNSLAFERLAQAIVLCRE